MKAKFDKDIIAVKKSHSLQEAEEDKYKYIDEIEDFHVATLMTLKEKYKTQSSIEVIDLMEREAESFGVYYNEWKKYHPNKSRYDFGFFLINREYYTLD